MQSFIVRGWTDRPAGGPLIDSDHSRGAESKLCPVYRSFIAMSGRGWGSHRRPSKTPFTSLIFHALVDGCVIGGDHDLKDSSCDHASRDLRFAFGRGIQTFCMHSRSETEIHGNDIPERRLRAPLKITPLKRASRP